VDGVDGADVGEVSPVSPVFSVDGDERHPVTIERPSVATNERRVRVIVFVTVSASSE